ncbi:MAG: polysaccharide biosynthesis tyrosine autokinase [Deltaproteobacteria bacterium]|nr:polysaccharide biosynthesis tyrosine autokinase [Deltaproteobacteria bacterium]
MNEPSTYFIRRGIPEPDYTELPTWGSEDEPSATDYWRAIVRRKRFILVLVIAALLGAGVLVCVMPPSYVATSTILIDHRAPKIEIKPAGSETQGLSDEETDNYYGTQYKVLQSRSLALRVIQDLALQDSPLFNSRPLLTRLGIQTGNRQSKAQIRQKEIDSYLEHLTVKPQSGTRLVTISFSAPDPLLAARIANAHVRAYVAQGAELRNEASTTARQFLETKLQEVKERVEKSEAALNDYRRQRGIVAAPSEDKTRVLTQRLADLEKALTAAETERIGLETETHLVRAGDYDSLPMVISSALIQNLKQEYAKAEANYASLASQFKPDYPELEEINAHRNELRSRLDREMQQVAAGIEWSYKAAVAREDELRKKVDAEKAEAAALNDASLQDALMAHEVESDQTLYRNVLAKINEMGVVGGAPPTEVSIIDQAEPPSGPSSPQKALILASAGMVSLFLGICVALLLDRIDDTFKDPDQVERSLALPCLGLVPDFTKLNPPSRRRLSIKPSSAAIPTVTPKLPAATAGTEINETFRAIRIGIVASHAVPSMKTVLITSGSVSEGKTMTAVNSALAFAQMGDKVLLIDADLRRSRCHSVLDIPNDAGLSEVLTGRRKPEDVVRSTGIEGLACITAGAPHANPGALLGSKKMADLLAYLRTFYDSILIDSAPVMQISDTLLLATMVDGVLLVAGPATPRRVLQTVCSRLHMVRAKLLGVVLNRLDIKLGNDGYYYSPDGGPVYHPVVVPGVSASFSTPSLQLSSGDNR